jgi:hypothetical protein
MQQRQLRLGDILDDYCPRERRLTNHAVVAMIGEEVKQTRCTTCDAEHEYKHAKVPRQRRKSEAPAALHSRVAPRRPNRIPHEAEGQNLQDVSEATGMLLTTETDSAPETPPEQLAAPDTESLEAPLVSEAPLDLQEDDTREPDLEEGPVHRPLIRATLPRPEGHPPPARQSPEFTIRQPGGRANRFRLRHQRSGQQFFGNRQNGNAGGSMRGGAPRQGGGRPPQGSMSPRASRRQGSGRKRSK